MLYRSDDNSIALSVSELVTLARRGISPTQCYDEDEVRLYSTKLPHGFSERDGVELTHPFECDGYKYSLRAYALKIDGNTVYTYAPVSSLREMNNRNVKAQYRGEGFVTAYIHALNNSYDAVRLVTVIYATETREVREEAEEIPYSKLCKFFERCISHVTEAGRAERERIITRVPTMKGLKFPYPGIRSGQNEFIRSAYRTIARGGELYATAPTGTGKTVSAIFPALRAIGDERISKVFYLTPKTTTAVAATAAVIAVVTVMADTTMIAVADIVINSFS